MTRARSSGSGTSAAPAGAPRPPSRTTLTGWGRTAPTNATVRLVDSDSALVALLAALGPRGAIARGLGRCYGDAAQNAGGSVLDMTPHAGIGPLRHEPTGTWVDLAGGTSLDRVMRELVPLGYFVPVTPGTRYVTAGGAFASDIHGKNHHRDGSFSQHVDSLHLRTTTTQHTLTPADERFWATAGGMGLTGVIESLRVRLRPIETSQMLVDTYRAVDLDACMAAMTDDDTRFDYSVAWIDLVARGSRLGRSVITSGQHATLSNLDRSAALDPLSYRADITVRAPRWAPNGLLRPLTIRAFNEVWFRKAPAARHTGLESIPTFFHPLDMVEGWNTLYGSAGFLQYQFVVPFGAEKTLRTIVEAMSNARCASFLAVLKRFGAGHGKGLLSFPIGGWTLALDIAASRADPALFDDLDRLVLDAGGRVYLAKDSRARPDMIAAMYPDLPRWRAIADELDPHHNFTSDLDRRLALRRPQPAPRVASAQ